MAIDSPAKRASALSAGRVYLRLIIPDGTIDDGDRSTIGNIYRGIVVNISVPFNVALTVASFAMSAKDLTRISASIIALTTASFSMLPKAFDIEAVLGWLAIPKGANETYSAIAKGDDESYTSRSCPDDETWTPMPKGKSP